MKHLKLFEQLIGAETPEEIKYFGVEPEVIKLRMYLRKIVKKSLGTEYGDYIRLEKNDRGYTTAKMKENVKTFSLILDTYNNYFIFQLDYKETGFWIKYTESCDNKLKNKIKTLRIFFDAIAEEKTDYGWRFNRDTFLSEIKNIDMYLNANKYNL